MIRELFCTLLCFTSLTINSMDEDTRLGMLPKHTQQPIPDARQQTQVMHRFLQLKNNPEPEDVRVAMCETCSKETNRSHYATYSAHNDVCFCIFCCGLTCLFANLMINN